MLTNNFSHRSHARYCAATKYLILGALIFSLGACDSDSQEKQAQTANDPHEGVEVQGMGRLQVSTVLGARARDEQGWAYADKPLQFSFPVDHGPHPKFRSEWWYLTSVLQDAQGHEYGMQFTLFRQALFPQDILLSEVSELPINAAVISGTRSESQEDGQQSAWRTNQAYLGHFALTDVNARQHFHAQRFGRGHPSFAAVTTIPKFSARISDWYLQEQSDCNTPEGAEVGICWQLQVQDHMQVAARGSEHGFSVRRLFGLGGNHKQSVSAQRNQTIAAKLHFSSSPLSPPSFDQGGIVLQGVEGLSHKGKNEASYYYSAPRLRTKGTIVVAGQTKEVSGWSWLDREWSTSVLGEHLQGWDWFSLQMDDGSNLMVFQLRRKDGERDPFDHGLLVRGDGTQLLHGKDYTLQPTRYWRDTQGISWPVAWMLTLFAGQQDEIEVNALPTTYLIEAMVDDQLMDVGIVYWEGIVAITRGGKSVGRGYMELTGY